MQMQFYIIILDIYSSDGMNPSFFRSSADFIVDFPYIIIKISGRHTFWYVLFYESVGAFFNTFCHNE